MELIIRNMVCDRCISTVRFIFDRQGVELESVELGKVQTKQSVEEQLRENVAQELRQNGFELVRDRESGIVERIKINLIAYLKHLEEEEKPDKLSDFITEDMRYNYSYLSKIHSDRLGMTIENHLIRLKIERVKELLGYRTYTLSEIAWKLKYSSVQYLSNQFRKITGMTVTEYLNQEHPGRKGLDKLQE